jgi:anti-sigma B factor antagonist
MLKFTTEEAGGVLVIAFEPTDVDAADWQSTQREWLYKLIESRADGRFAIDLSEINYLQSSEIGFLMTLKRRIDRRQGKFVMFGVGAYLHDIFRTMNLTKIVDIVDDLASAVAKLGSATGS